MAHAVALRSLRQRSKTRIGSGRHSEVNLFRIVMISASLVSMKHILGPSGSWRGCGKALKAACKSSNGIIATRCYEYESVVQMCRSFWCSYASWMGKAKHLFVRIPCYKHQAVEYLETSPKNNSSQGLDELQMICLKVNEPKPLVCCSQLDTSIRSID